MPFPFHIVLQNNSAATFTPGVLAVLPGDPALISLGASPASGDPYDTYTFIHQSCDQAVEDDGDAALLISRWGLTTNVDAWVVNGLGPAQSQAFDITASPGQVLSFAARVVGSGDDGVYLYTVGDRNDATVDLFDSNDLPLANVTFGIGGIDVVDCGTSCPPATTGCLGTQGGGGDSVVPQTGASGCTATSWYLDVDDDGYGDPVGGVSACSAPNGRVADASDCDDTRYTVHPDTTEVCNGRDDDCDTFADDDDPGLDPDSTLPWYPDEDGDGYGAPTGAVLACVAPPGYDADSTDCDDDAFRIHPTATEIADDGVDQDCDGEDLVTPVDTDTAVDTDTSVDTETSGGRPFQPVPDTDAPTPGEACGCATASEGSGYAALLLLLVALRRRAPGHASVNTSRIHASGGQSLPNPGLGTLSRSVAGQTRR